MAEILQLDFFKDDDILRLESEILEAKKASERVRKGVFARLNELQKKYDEVYENHLLFKKAICQGDFVEKKQLDRN